MNTFFFFFFSLKVETTCTSIYSAQHCYFNCLTLSVITDILLSVKNVVHPYCWSCVTFPFCSIRSNIVCLFKSGVKLSEGLKCLRILIPIFWNELSIRVPWYGRKSEIKLLTFPLLFFKQFDFFFHHFLSVNWTLYLFIYLFCWGLLAVEFIFVFHLIAIYCFVALSPGLNLLITLNQRHHANK